MAPLSRGRSGSAGMPTALNALYYSQRAAAGLIIAEAADVASYPTDTHRLRITYARHAEAWRLVTDAVHAAGGRIVLQLCHSVPQDGKAPNIAVISDAFAASARHARDAGFDGIEIHAGSKHLVGGLLHKAGLRGASDKERAQALFAVLDAVVPIWGREYVGVRLSFDDFAGSFSLLDHVAGRMQAQEIGYLHAVAADAPFPVSLRAHFRGPVILAGRFDRRGAEEGACGWQG